jgi:hypothetical protein
MSEAYLARARFVCGLCGDEAGTAELVAEAGGTRFTRISFTSKLSGAVPPEKVAALRSVLDSADARGLHELDFEYAPFYCPPCNAVYCHRHWVRWDVFDDDSWHDSIRGRCPQAHERMLED